MLKKNIDEFNSDVSKYGGYEYTSNNKFSSFVANYRLTKATIEKINFLLKRNEKIESVIDIGCGDGSYTNELYRCFKNISFVGMDPASNAIEEANKKFKTELLNFMTGNILEPVADGSKKIYNVAIIRGVLHHLSDPELAIKNSSNMAHSLIIIEPNGYNPVLKLIEKLSPYHRAHEEQSYLPYNLRKWVNNSNLKIVDEEYVGFIPFFFPTIPAKIIYFFQPLLEKIPVLKNLFSACVVITCTK